jgi:hypothetical protein
MSSASKERIMRMTRISKGDLLLLTVAVLALASPAAADNKHNKSGNARVPSYFAYPRGRNLAQHYAQPSAGIGSLAAFNSSQGSVLGRPGMNLRNAADRIQWPEVKDDFDPHVAGQPYACFTWDLIVQLKAKFSGDEKKAYDKVKELTLGAAALNPRDVPDAVRLVFFVGHQNGSKFFDEMAKSADAHGIPRPATPEDLNNPANLNLATK